MNLKELLKRLIWQENELYNLYKLGETFATYERPEFKDTFMLMAEEELRHRKTLEGMLEDGALENTAVVEYLDGLSMEPMLVDERSKPETLEELVLDALIREKHAYELYRRLSSMTEGSLSQIFGMMASEELKHGYRLKLIYEAM